MQEKYRKAVFLIVYHIENNKPKYLLLKRNLHWKGWEFPKGGIEKSEDKKQAIVRELKEETGLVPVRIEKHKKSGKYKYDFKTMQDRDGLAGQTFDLYSVEVKKGKVHINLKEHSGFRWVNFSKAVKMLTWKNQENCLKLVDSKLRK